MHQPRKSDFGNLFRLTSGRYSQDMYICCGKRLRRFRECAILLGAVVGFALLLARPGLVLAQDSPPAVTSVPTPAANSDCLPIATSSPEAARLFEEGLHLRYDFHTAEALVKFREAARKDPAFARARAYIVLLGSDPAEAKWASDKARLASQNASPGDQLLVRWVTSSDEGHFLDAIQAMNDLMAKCPRDAQLNYEAGLWVRAQGDGAGAVRLTQRALEIKPDFAGALNTLAYQLASMRKYEPAISYLKRYIELEPKDANPYDSLAEILQMAGRVEESLAEYRRALSVDPKFFSSQKGLGNDYALLGNEEHARQEYAKALPLAATPQEKLDTEIQAASTYAREGDRKRARVELAKVLDEATKLKISDYQSLIHQDLALLADSPAIAFRHLDAAEAALPPSAHVSGARRDRMLARSLETRARLAAEFGNLAMAHAAVARLDKMLQTSRSNAVERAYHGANGALMAAQKKNRAAIEELEEDPENAPSIAKLAQLQEVSGSPRDAAETRALLQADYAPSLEDWLVVRNFRH